MKFLKKYIYTNLSLLIIFISCSENESKQAVSEGFTNKKDTLVKESIDKKDSIIKPKIPMSEKISS